MNNDSSPSFPATRWSVISRAKGWTGEATEACKILCEQYYYPVYSFLRKRGFDHDVAIDNAHGFFADFLEQKRPWQNALRGVQPRRGVTFRSCIIMSLKSFLSEQRRKEAAQKRGGAAKIVSLDAMAAEQRYRCEPAYDDPPDSAFVQSWAREICDCALISVKEGYASKRFEALKVYLVANEKGPPYAETAERLGMSENGVKQAVKRLRASYANSVRRLIADTVDDPEDVEREWDELLQALTTRHEAKND